MRLQALDRPAHTQRSRPTGTQRSRPTIMQRGRPTHTQRGEHSAHLYMKESAHLYSKELVGMYTVDSSLATEGSTHMHLGVSSLMHNREGPLVQREVCPLYSDGLVHKFTVISHLYTMCQPTCTQRFSFLYKVGQATCT